MATLSRPGWAKRIHALRKSRGENQTVFGGALATSAMSVSRWETGTDEPTAANYIGLAKLAGPKQCWYYWERAGLEADQVIKAVAARKTRR